MSTLKYTKITFDGTIVETDDNLTLPEMQQFVGGYIEYVGNVICNEDGLMLKLPTNVKYPKYVGNIIVREPGTEM